MGKHTFDEKNKTEMHRLMGATGFVHKKKHKGKNVHLKEVAFLPHKK